MLVSVTAEVEMDEFSNRELLDELKRRLSSLSKKEREEFRQMVDENPFQIKTLDDRMKIDHLVSVFNKYNSAFIETVLP